MGGFKLTKSHHAKSVEMQDTMYYIMLCAHTRQKLAMPRTSTAPKGETFTFRLDPALKKALTRSAAAEHRRPAELVRNLVRGYLAAKECRAFETEARRQSLTIAQRAHEQTSDEAQIMREIEADLEHDDFAREWKA